MPRPHDRARASARVAALFVSLVVLLPVAAAAVPVEGYAPYQPQRKCNPTAKAGTLELARWLQKQYPGTGSLGISRACGHGGVSEHKEGRAFDWAVNHSSARDRGYAKNLLARLFATDRQGNRAALARRMGIMYLIWNDHIYASYRGFAKRDYLSSSCRTKKKCSVTLRHRNHVHISLSRPGGRGDTSWYPRDDPAPRPPATKPPTTPQPEPEPTPPPAPEPEPVPVPENVVNLKRKPYAKLSVGGDGEPVVARFALAAGTTYKITASGLVTYGRPDQVADATCVWSPADRTWSQQPDTGTSATHGSLNLTVNGKAAFGSDCHTRGHTYVTKLTPKRKTALRLRLVNNGPEAAVPSGRIIVTVSKKRTDVTKALPSYPPLDPAPRASQTAPRGYGLLAETVTVPAEATGVTTTQELQEGARYRVTVSGVAGLGQGVRSDGRCVQVGDTWFTAASLDRRYPDQDHGNLFLDGVAFAGRSTGEGCAAHEYVADHRATRTGRLELSMWDPLERGDNQGALTVRVQRLSDLPTPRAAQSQKPGRADAWTVGREWLQVPADSAKGTVSTLKLRKGEEVQIVVRGGVRSHGVDADASCVLTGAGWAARDAGLAVRQDPLNLWVDGHEVTWRALGPTAGCSTDEHGYIVRYTAVKHGRLRLAVLDLDHRDNQGTLKVTLLRQK
jgi:hypothetical protein